MIPPKARVFLVEIVALIMEASLVSLMAVIDNYVIRKWWDGHIVTLEKIAECFLIVFILWLIFYSAPKLLIGLIVFVKREMTIRKLLVPSFIISCAITAILSVTTPLWWVLGYLSGIMILVAPYVVFRVLEYLGLVKWTTVYCRTEQLWRL